MLGAPASDWSSIGTMSTPLPSIRGRGVALSTSLTSPRVLLSLATRDSSHDQRQRRPSPRSTDPQLRSPNRPCAAPNRRLSLRSAPEHLSSRSCPARPLAAAGRTGGLQPESAASAARCLSRCFPSNCGRSISSGFTSRSVWSGSFRASSVGCAVIAIGAGLVIGLSLSDDG